VLLSSMYVYNAPYQCLQDCDELGVREGRE
jgi:hypothetical protein